MLKAVKITLLSAIVVSLLPGCLKKHPDLEHLYKPAPISETMQDFFDRNGVQPQHFTGDADTWITFTGQKGFTVNIPANSFVDCDGRNVTGMIDITFKEAVSKSDFILSNKPTQTEDDALVSAGSYYLSAEQNGKKLKFKGNSHFLSLIHI